MIEPSPLQERLFVPWLIRFAAHHGKRHLLVLLFDGPLRKDLQFRRIVALKSCALTVQISDLTGVFSHENDHVVVVLTSLRMSA